MNVRKSSSAHQGAICPRRLCPSAPRIDCEQVESVKVWQTRPDYFLDAHAASSISKTNSDGSAIAIPGGGATITAAEMDQAAGQEARAAPASHSTSSMLGYVLCAVGGGVIGAALVGLVMIRHNKPAAGLVGNSFAGAAIGGASYQTIQGGAVN